MSVPPIRALQTIGAAQARAALLWLSRRGALQRLTVAFPPARRVARRFIAGETLAEAIATARALTAQGFHTTVAFLGEHVTDPREARAAAAEYDRLLRALAAAHVDVNCSLKLSQLGILFDAALAEALLRQIVAVAEELSGFVRMDMESSDLVQPTLDLYEHMTAACRGRPRVGVVIQSYLRRSEADVRRLIARGAPVRLVKGAYAEPPTVAYPRKADVDASYLRLADLLLSEEARAHGVYPAFATHDPALIAAVRRMAQARGIPPTEYEFQMLLGVRRDLQETLCRAGLRVRIYIPYGSHWYPYFMRRLAERPANLWFLVRAVVHG